MSVGSAESGTSASRKAGQKGREGGRREGRKRGDGWRGGRGRGTKVGTERARAQQWSTSHPTPSPPSPAPPIPLSPLEEKHCFRAILVQIPTLGPRLDDGVCRFACEEALSSPCAYVVPRLLGRANRTFCSQKTFAQGVPPCRIYIRLDRQKANQRDVNSGRCTLHGKKTPTTTKQCGEKLRHKKDAKVQHLVL